MAESIRESVIEGYLVQKVEALGGEIRKLAWIGRRGAPDRILFMPNVARSSVLVELKAPGVPPEAYQIREHARLRNLGQRVEVIDSKEAVDHMLFKLMTQ